MLDKHYVTLRIHWQLPAGKNLIPVMSCKSRSTFSEAARHPLDMNWQQRARSVACTRKPALRRSFSYTESRERETGRGKATKSCLVLYSSYAAHCQPCQQNIGEKITNLKAFCVCLDFQTLTLNCAGGTLHVPAMSALSHKLVSNLMTSFKNKILAY